MELSRNFESLSNSNLKADTLTPVSDLQHFTQVVKDVAPHTLRYWRVRCVCLEKTLDKTLSLEEIGEWFLLYETLKLKK